MLSVQQRTRYGPSFQWKSARYTLHLHQLTLKGTELLAQRSLDAHPCDDQLWNEMLDNKPRWLSSLDHHWSMLSLCSLRKIPEKSRSCKDQGHNNFQGRQRAPWVNQVAEVLLRWERNQALSLLPPQDWSGFPLPHNQHFEEHQHLKSFPDSLLRRTTIVCEDVESAFSVEATTSEDAPT